MPQKAFRQQVFYSNTNGSGQTVFSDVFDGRLAKMVHVQAVVTDTSANGQFSLILQSSLDGVNFEDVATVLSNQTGTALGYTSSDSGTKLRFKMGVSASTGGALESVTAEVWWGSKPF